jgi:membrane-bound inhibitor of C-type lysozyme
MSHEVLRKLEQQRFSGRVRWPGIILLALLLGASLLFATDFVNHLPDTPTVSRQSVTYQCDSNGPDIGVPAEPFPVEYINGGGNRLAIVPISGNALIFSNVSSASGVRYTSQQYTWWETKGTAMLYSDSINRKLQSSCHIVPVQKDTRRKN